MNAEIGYFTRATKDLWTQLVELQPQTGEAGTGISREEFIGNIASDIQVCRYTTVYIIRHVNSHALRVRHTHLDINSRSHAKSRKSHALPRVLSLSSDGGVLKLFGLHKVGWANNTAAC